jgi:hypothetical protein
MGRQVFRILEIIFVHFVARSFCVKIKLPQEMPKNRMPKVPKMPKMPKIMVSLRSVFFISR